MARRRIVGDFLRELVDDGDGRDERFLTELADRLDDRDEPAAVDEPAEPAAIEEPPDPAEPAPEVAAAPEPEQAPAPAPEATPGPGTEGAALDTAVAESADALADPPPVELPATRPRPKPASSPAPAATADDAADREDGLDILARGVDGKFRDADGFVVEGVSDDGEGTIHDEEGNLFDAIIEPVGDIGALKFDAFGNLVDERNQLIVPVDELQFDEAGNVVDETGQIVAAQQRFEDDPFDEEGEDARLARIRAENAAAPPVTLIRGVDGSLTAPDGSVSQSHALLNRDGELTDFEGHRVAEVIAPVGLVGGVLFDHEGNVVDRDGTVIVPVEDVQFDADGNVVDADGTVVVPFRDTEGEAAEEERMSVLNRGVDGLVRDADGDVRDVRQTEDGLVDEEGNAFSEILEPVGPVGALQFDAFGNLVDEHNDLLAAPDELFFDEQGNAVDADGNLLAEQQRFADDDPPAGDELAIDEPADVDFGGGAVPSTPAAIATAPPSPPPVDVEEVRATVEQAVSSAVESAGDFLSGIFGGSDEPDDVLAASDTAIDDDGSDGLPE